MHFAVEEKKNKNPKNKNKNLPHTQGVLLGGGNFDSQPVYELLCLSFELDFLVSWLFVA